VHDVGVWAGWDRANIWNFSQGETQDCRKNKQQKNCSTTMIALSQFYPIGAVGNLSGMMHFILHARYSIPAGRKQDARIF
jgi:hypothetical protein